MVTGEKENSHDSGNDSENKVAKKGKETDVQVRFAAISPSDDVKGNQRKASIQSTVTLTDMADTGMPSACTTPTGQSESVTPR